MLIRFSVENNLSFRDEVVFSMIASVDDRHPNHVRPGSGPSKPGVLRTAAIYGANGHGKTNFVEALDYLRSFVVQGSQELRVLPFMLNRTSPNQPSRFVIEFRAGEVDYEYGLVAARDKVLEEWLYARMKRGQAALFERKVSATGESEFEFGPTLMRSNSPAADIKQSDYLRFLAVGIKNDATFLAEAAARKVEAVQQAFGWFKDQLYIVTAEAHYGNIHGRAQSETDFLAMVSEYLREADIGLEEIAVEEIVIGADTLADLPAPVSEEALRRVKELDEGLALAINTPEGPGMILKREADGTVKFLKLVARHVSEEGDLVNFEIFAESAGTRRLMDLIPMIADVQTKDVVYVVDELDRKLHPLLAYRFIESFLKCPNGQLIFTTHNTQLLDLSLLRRDEIWFVQKTPQGHSDMYSLLEFKIRPDLDIRRGYLNGRFGAIPFLGNLQDLGWCSDETQ